MKTTKKELTDRQKIAFGVCIGSLLSMIVIFLTANPADAIYIIPITIISSIIYDK